MFGGFNFFRIFLYPIALLYGAGVGIRNFLYEAKVLKSKSYNIPTISIGNLAVGGTGKTPHVEYIITLLKNDFRVAMLSRGYKRKTKGFRLAGENDNASTIGDEPYQIKQKFGKDICVAVDANRQRGIENLLKEETLNAIIMDDAFQHRKVHAGLNILLTEFHSPFTKDHFLPYGRLREHPHEHRRAHIIIVTKCPKNIKPIEKRLIDKEIKIYPFQYLFFTSLKYGDLTNVFDPTDKIKLSDISQKHAIGVSGIANNKHFKSKIQAHTLSLKHTSYMDHHDYSARDILKIQANFNQIRDDHKIIITTEKDAVKLKNNDNWDESVKKYVYYLPIKVVFLGNEKQEDEFKQQITKYVKTNRRYSKLYKGQNLYST